MSGMNAATWERESVDSVPIALTIAGSDPTGGAGIQADLEVFRRHGVHGTTAIAVITIQDTNGVREVVPLDPPIVAAQIDAILEDLPPLAAKTGALGTAGIVEAVAARALESPFPLVVDPILSATGGAPLLDEGGREALRVRLLPVASIVTPNLAEAAWLAGMEVRDLDGMESAARAIAEMGPAAVLVTGGGGADEAVDVLYSRGAVHALREERVKGCDAHGTGCALSAAIAAHLARGAEVMDAVRGAKAYVTRAIRSMRSLGRGAGLLDHGVETGAARAISDLPRGEGSDG